MLIPIKCDVDVFHLNLVLAFFFLPLHWLLTHFINVRFEARNDPTVLLLAEDVVLKLSVFDFFKSARFFESIHIHVVVCLI